MLGISIVSYKPDIQTIQRIQELAYSLNSHHFEISIFSNDSNVLSIEGAHIISAGGDNIGLGAHNRNAKYLRSKGCTYLLLLDQDSEITAEMIDGLLSTFKQLPAESMLGPRLLDGEKDRRRLLPFIPMPCGKPSLISTKFISTSGTLILMEYWNVLGGYREELFIGELDREFCHRVLENGGRIFIANNIVIPHQVGRGRVGVGRLSIVKHESGRYYYYCRNKIRLLSEGVYGTPQLIQLILYFSGIVVTLPWQESPLKVARSVLVGFIDGINRVGGARRDI